VPVTEPGQEGAAAVDPPAPTVRLPVAVLVIAATVIAALLVVALVVRLDADRLPTAPPRDPPVAPPAATAFEVARDRTATFQDFSVRLPGTPYVCGDSPDPPRGFTAYEGCTHLVHRDYDGAGHDWTALSGVLVVGDALVTPDDPGATTRSVFDTLVDQLYVADDHPSVRKVSSGGVQLPVPAERLGSRFGNVEVRRRGLDTPYDRLAVVVVQLESGRCVAFFSDFPHDAGKPALEAVTTALNTISLQR
jgi:hypothetical protein